MQERLLCGPLANRMTNLDVETLQHFRLQQT